MELLKRTLLFCCMFFCCYGDQRMKMLCDFVVVNDSEAYQKCSHVFTHKYVVHVGSNSTIMRADMKLDGEGVSFPQHVRRLAVLRVLYEQEDIDLIDFHTIGEKVVQDPGIHGVMVSFKSSKMGTQTDMLDILSSMLKDFSKEFYLSYEEEYQQENTEIRDTDFIKNIDGVVLPDRNPFHNQDEIYPQNPLHGKHFNDTYYNYEFIIGLFREYGFKPSQMIIKFDVRSGVMYERVEPECGPDFGDYYKSTVNLPYFQFCTDGTMQWRMNKEEGIFYGYNCSHFAQLIVPSSVYHQASYFGTIPLGGLLLTLPDTSQDQNTCDVTPRVFLKDAVTGFLMTSATQVT